MADASRRSFLTAAGGSLLALAAPGAPVRVRLRFADVTTPQILEAIPGVRRTDGYTVAFTAPTMADAYRLIRLVYKFVVV